MQKVIVRVVDDVLRRFQGMSADVEIGSGDWMPKRPDPGEVGLQQHDLVNTALEVGDRLDLARAGAIEDEPMVARDRERSTATPSLRLTRYPALLETASTDGVDAAQQCHAPLASAVGRETKNQLTRFSLFAKDR